MRHSWVFNTNEDLHKRVKRRALEDGTTIQDLVEQALERHLAWLDEEHK